VHERFKAAKAFASVADRFEVLEPSTKVSLALRKTWNFG
jgi:hypothetical protein